MAEMLPPQHHTGAALWDAHIEIADFREDWDGDDPDHFTQTMRTLQDRACSLALLHAAAESQSRYEDPIQWIWGREVGA